MFPVATLTDVPRRDSYIGISSSFSSGFILPSQISQTQGMLLPQTQGDWGLSAGQGLVLFSEWCHLL